MLGAPLLRRITSAPPPPPPLVGDQLCSCIRMVTAGGPARAALRGVAYARAPAAAQTLSARECVHITDHSQLMYVNVYIIRTYSGARPVKAVIIFCLQGACGLLYIYNF
jgi:hypothetical protein